MKVYVEHGVSCKGYWIEKEGFTELDYFKSSQPYLVLAVNKFLVDDQQIVFVVLYSITRY